MALANCAQAGPYNPYNLASSNRAQVAGICTNVIGLSGGDQHSYACMDALFSSLNGVAGSRALGAAQGECLRSNLQPGTPAFAQCELDRSRYGQGSGSGYALLPATAQTRTPPERSYWSASNAEIHRREQTACAALGLEPVGDAFAQCVASLEVALFSASNPSQ